ncbi:MAG: regulatory protein RecX [Gemmatimonas sp.]|nr:regulatory protein RecX [Gemmatimonas sp.]
MLTLSDGQQFLVPAGVLADTGAVRIGALMAAELLGRLQHEHAVTSLADWALDALARGRRTRRELELRMRRREGTAMQVREALDRLDAAGLLNDESVAQAEAASRLRRGEAPARIQQRLRRKGVAAPLVHEAVVSAMHDDAFDEDAACRAAAEKRARTLDTTDPVAARRKLQGFLLRRGFAAGIAARVARSVLDSRRAG